MKRFILILSIVSVFWGCSADKEDLILAIKNNDIRQVKKVVNRDVELFGYSDADDPSLLISGIKNLDMLQVLLDVGYINFVDEKELTNFTDHNWIEAIDLLLDHGLKHNAMIDYDGPSLFDWTIINNHKELTLKMISLGADINKDYGGSGSTSFITALAWYDLDFVRTLVEEYDADIEAVNKYGESVLEFLISKGYFEKYKLIVESGADYSKVSKHGYNPWELLADNWRGDESLKIANYLYDIGLNFEYKNNMALHISSKKHEIEFVEWLLEHGFDPNIIDNEGFKANSYAYDMIKLTRIDGDAEESYLEEVDETALEIDFLIKSYQKKSQN